MITPSVKIVVTPNHTDSNRIHEGAREDNRLYPNERKEAILQKMLSPKHQTIKAIAEQEGISEATLYNGRKAAHSAGRLLPDGDNTPAGWSSADKFAAVVESASLNESDLAEYCRQRGLYTEQLTQWRAACEHANDWDRQPHQPLKSARQADQKRLQSLERELAKKAKALAETAALLVLSKKAEAIWGVGEDASSVPLIAVKLINTAREAGACQVKACERLHLSVRTYILK